MKLEYVACAVCGAEKYEPYLVRKDLYLFLPGDFHLVKCLNCGLVYLNPRPSVDSFDEIYTEGYGPYTESIKSEKVISQRLRSYGVNKRAKAVVQHKKGGSLLDVGCATGDFLSAMQSFPGWELYGVEPSLSASEKAREMGLDVTTGSVETVDFPAGLFDVVTMWNVLEHLASPLSVLNKIRSWLKPDGLLVFNTPNLDSLDARIFGQYWAGFELPRHFTVFSRKSIHTILDRTGFQLVDTQCVYGSHALFMSGVRFWLRARSNPPAPNPAIEPILFSLPARIVFAPLMYVLDQLKLTTAPVDFCAKVPHESN